MTKLKLILKEIHSYMIMLFSDILFLRNNDRLCTHVICTRSCAQIL